MRSLPIREQHVAWLPEKLGSLCRNRGPSTTVHVFSVFVYLFSRCGWSLPQAMCTHPSEGENVVNHTYCILHFSVTDSIVLVNTICKTPRVVPPTLNVSLIMDSSFLFKKTNGHNRSTMLKLLSFIKWFFIQISIFHDNIWWHQY